MRFLHFGLTIAAILCLLASSDSAAIDATEKVSLTTTEVPSEISTDGTYESPTTIQSEQPQPEGDAQDLAEDNSTPSDPQVGGSSTQQEETGPQNPQDEDSNQDSIPQTGVPDPHAEPDPEASPSNESSNEVSGNEDKCKNTSLCGSINEARDTFVKHSDPECFCRWDNGQPVGFACAPGTRYSITAGLCV